MFGIQCDIRHCGANKKQKEIKEEKSTHGQGIIFNTVLHITTKIHRMFTV